MNVPSMCPPKRMSYAAVQTHLVRGGDLAAQQVSTLDLYGKRFIEPTQDARFATNYSIGRRSARYFAASAVLPCASYKRMSDASEYSRPD